MTVYSDSYTHRAFLKTCRTCSTTLSKASWTCSLQALLTPTSPDFPRHIPTYPDKHRRVEICQGLSDYVSLHNNFKPR